MSGPGRDPVWPDQIELQTDLSPSEWIRPRLSPWGRDGTRVTSVVPSGFPAYVRVLHPATTGDRLQRDVRWRHVAALSRRTYHPLMQFGRINIPTGTPHGHSQFGAPDTGHLGAELCASLYTSLATWTARSEVCWMGVWVGWGSLGYPRSMTLLRFGRQAEAEDDRSPSLERQLTEIAERVGQAARFEHPGRTYLLARGPSSAICQLGRPPLAITPSLVWPDDRAWCVATDIDFDSTLVGCSDTCAAALVTDERLEAVSVPSDGRLDIEGDELNPRTEEAP